MKIRSRAALAARLLLFPVLVLSACRHEESDAYYWLEEIDGERALEWVRAQNASTAERLQAYSEFDSFYAEARAALDSASRIPEVEQRGEYLYNLWRDEEHPRGLYRRTTLDELRQEQPHWQTVLDIDALSAADGEKWVFKRMHCLPDEYRHCLLFLSPGGGDATVVREFDMESLAFVAGGFELPVAKNQVDWLDADTLFVGTDFGAGSMTESGYPRIVKLWRRGTSLAEARTLYEGSPSSVGAGGERYHMDAGDIDLVSEGLTFWRSVRYQLAGDELQELELPETATVEDGYRGKLVVSLKEDWNLGDRTLHRGSVVIAAPESLWAGAERAIEVLVEPTAEAVVEDVDATRDAILVTMLDNVRGRLYRYRPAADGTWQRDAISFPDNGSLLVATTDSGSGSFFVEYESFTTPPTLYHVGGPDWLPERIKAQDATFDSSR
ncbi:MAG: S9 family peptidase, partial [Acidobacteriota bacterium]|nr:S9 family peptidase [Acidobacteriota bacterium]